MQGDRVLLAIARIEAAAERIGNAARGPAVATGDASLASRHAALRREAELALAQIDALIGSAGQ